MIWRDDDISYLTDLPKFKQVHEIFEKHNIVHTVAVIAQDLDKNPELIEYLKGPLFDVQLHCFEHVDLSLMETDQLLKDIETAIVILETHFKRPTTLYPPWNKSSEKLEQVAKFYGLQVSNQKITLSQYVKVMGGVKEDVINFHYWHDPEIILLEPALKIFTKKPVKNICE